MFWLVAVGGFEPQKIKLPTFELCGPRVDVPTELGKMMLPDSKIR